ncbi:MAG TPA: peptide chain release factor 2 [Candidatus Limnocylindrales bacterium]|nr:peptide chain release factor 2 [Candidatus Limnocylindrales bacterium]
MPSPELLPLREPGQGAGQGQPAGRDGRAPDGGVHWTQLGTRPSASLASSPKPRCAFDHGSHEAELAELTERSADPNLWDDPDEAQATMRRAEELRSEIETWRSLGERASGLAEMAEMAAGEPDEAASLLPDLERDLAALQADWNRMEQLLLLGEPFDERGAIVSIHAGAGGTESQDWAEMLLRMYLRWAERHRFKTEILEATEGEGAGLKSVSFSIDGRWVYGRLRSERGVHRLVRISPFDSQKRRHTTFALVEIMPEVPEDAAVEIDEKDLRVDTYRASGAGGQHVNKTDSAVRLTHEPTGIVVAVQSERSQHQNRDRAMAVLRARLIERQEEEREAEMARLRGEHVEAGWGNQIRSYVLQPYTMVKDLRTGVETSNPTAVLDGDLDAFIEGYLRSRVGTGDPTPAA